MVLGRLNTLVKQFVYQSSLNHGLSQQKAREAQVNCRSPPRAMIPLKGYDELMSKIFALP
jgi:hypothetical protein